MNKKILFITHETSRTGAPLVLFYFLQWLKENRTRLHFTVLDIHEGDLSEDFKAIANEYYCLEKIKKKRISFYQEFEIRILKRMGKYKAPMNPKDLIIQELAKKNFDLIYANSVLSLPVANEVKSLSKSSKLMLHVHELNTIIQQLLPDFSKIINRVDEFVAVSDLVKRNLSSTYHVHPGKINVIYEFSKQPATQKSEVKDIFIVGGAGTVHWRKGSDIFIQVARYIKDHYKEVALKFEWIGYLSEEQKFIAEGDIQKAGLQGVVSFVGEKEDPLEFFRKFDVFLLPSREDPFPLVAIETGMLGKPIICFEKATGIAEFLHNGGGFVVPYLDTEAMAEKIIFYHKNRKNLEKDGNAARKIFSEFTSEKKCPEIFSLIQQLVNE